MGRTRSINILTVLKTVGAALAIAQSAAVAYHFGTSREVELYFAAVTLLSVVTRLTQTGQVAEILLPILVDQKTEGRPELAYGLFSAVVNWMVVLTLACSLLLWVVASPIIRFVVPGFDAPQQMVSVSLFRAMVPLLGLQILTAFMNMLANAEKWFGRPQIAHAISRAFALAIILFFSPRFGIWALVLAMWVSVAGNMVGCMVIVHRLGYRHRLVLSSEVMSPFAVLGNIAYTSVYVGATQLYTVILTAALSHLPEGTLAVFRYVDPLFDRFRGVFVRPVLTVFYTDIAATVRRGTDTVRSLGQQALGRGLAVVALGNVIMLSAGQYLLAALWGIDRFGNDELKLAWILLSLRFLTLVVILMGQLSWKIGIALGQVRETYLFASVLRVVVAVAVFAAIDAFGVPGALYGTVAARVVMMIGYMVPVFMFDRRCLAFFRWQDLAAWSVSIASGWFVVTIITPVILPFLPNGRISQLAVGLLFGGLASVVAVSVAYLLAVTEVREAAKWGVDRWLRFKRNRKEAA